MTSSQLGPLMPNWSGLAVPASAGTPVLQVTPVRTSKCHNLERRGFSYADLAILRSVVLFVSNGYQSHRYRVYQRFHAGGVSWTTVRRYFASGTMTISCFLVRNRSNLSSSWYGLAIALLFPWTCNVHLCLLPAPAVPSC